MASVDPLLQVLDYRFTDMALLRRALTHRSHSGQHNERLEFLGDSVLNFIVAALLYERFPDLDEGDLSRLRANLVKQSALADIAGRLNLSRYLRLGEGELKSGGFRRPSILADTLEAVFGAVFLDGGFDAARHVVGAQYQAVLADINPLTLGKDPKTLLQELLQARKLELPVYTVVNTHGAAHDQLFDVECHIDALGIVVAASGSSRRAAEQVAAQGAIDQIRRLGPPSVAQRKAVGESAGSGSKARRARRASQLSLPVAVTQDKK